MRNERKVAGITGASQGIGAALVKAYRDRNYRVVATARSLKPSNDDEVLAVPGDIADRRTAERVISQGMARFGRIDTLVNNAGIFIAKPFTQYPEADYVAVLGVNLAGFFHSSQLAIAEMEKKGSGHIVQITMSLVDHAMASVPVRPRVADEGRLEWRDQIARDRVRQARYPGKRGRPGHHQDAYESSRDARFLCLASSHGPNGDDRGHRRRGTLSGGGKFRGRRDPPRRRGPERGSPRSGKEASRLSGSARGTSA